MWKFKKLGLHKLSKERSAHQHQVFNSTSHHFFMMIHNHTFLLCYRMFWTSILFSGTDYSAITIFLIMQWTVNIPILIMFLQSHWISNKNHSSNRYGRSWLSRSLSQYLLFGNYRKSDCVVIVVILYVAFWLFHICACFCCVWWAAFSCFIFQVYNQSKRYEESTPISGKHPTAAMAPLVSAFMVFSTSEACSSFSKHLGCVEGNS